MKKIVFFVLVSVSLVSNCVKAQLFLRPLNSSLSTQIHAQARITSTDADSVLLPFFDDFAGYYGAADISRWKPSDVFINNDYAVNPPTINAATFDGIDAKGKPYNFVNELAEGYADVLESKRINLASHLLNDTLVMLFYWQPQGIGDAPEEEDSLMLQLKDKQGNWITTWVETGRQNIAFQKVELFITDTAYFHQDFSFRFQSYGRISGWYDVWNLDYVLFYDKATYSPESYKDAGMSDNLTPILNNGYQAMPAMHFAAASKLDSDGKIISSPLLTDTLRTKFTNFADFDNITVTGQKLEIYDAVAKNNLKNITSSITGIAETSTGNIFIYRDEVLNMRAPNDLAGIKITDSMQLEYKMYFSLNEKNIFTLGQDTVPFLTRSNDTVRRTLPLANYYAYDDGTAEYSFGLQAAAGRFALKYYLSRFDTLTHIDIYFPEHQNDLTTISKSFYICVWKHIDLKNQRNDIRLVRQSVALNYADARNKFMRIKLNTKYLVADSIYVGFEEPSTGTYYQLLVGYDKSNDARNRSYYNVLGTWLPNDLSEKGSPMIRPVFASKSIPDTVVNSLSDDDFQAATLIYPNPSTGGFYVESEYTIANLTVTDMTGKVIHTQIASPDTEGLSFQLRERGFYLVYMTDTKKRRIIRKVIVH